AGSFFAAGGSRETELSGAPFEPSCHDFSADGVVSRPSTNSVFGFGFVFGCGGGTAATPDREAESCEFSFAPVTAIPVGFGAGFMSLMPALGFSEDLPNWFGCASRTLPESETACELDGLLLPSPANKSK